jgi:23S rRNA pseudouridine1911/1915/1917 synthase
MIYFYPLSVFLILPDKIKFLNNSFLFDFYNQIFTLKQRIFNALTIKGNQLSKTEIVIKPGTILNLIASVTEIRLDNFLSEQLSDYSRSFFKTLIEQERVLVNNKVAKKAGLLLKEGDKITVSFPGQRIEKRYNQVELDALKIEIIFEHKDFLVIYKPAGVLVHPPSNKSETICLTDWIVSSYKAIEFVGATTRPGIVHRLDKDTSGLLLIALNNTAHTKLSDLFKNRTITKTYLAVVKGHPEPEGTIDFPIGRHHTLRNKMALRPEGRPSLTHYKVLTYFEDCALVQVKPVTGRTHQIRLHFAQQGHPLLGDVLYGTPSKQIKRHALHAYKISFEYDEKSFSFEKEAPQDFVKLIEQLKKF